MTDLHVDVGSFCISISVHETKQLPRDLPKRPAICLTRS